MMVCSKSCELEERYVVVKFSDLQPHQRRRLMGFIKETLMVPTRKAVVVEADWPIYDKVVEMVLER